MEETKNSQIKNICIVVALIIACIVLIVLSARNRPKSAYTIAYYDVPGNVAAEISSALETKFVGGIKYLQWDETFIPSKKILKQVDLVVTWNGAKADFVSKTANVKTDHTPLLIDGFDLHTLKSNGQFFNISIPTTLEEFYQYTEQAKSFAEYPIFVDCSTPEDFLAFVGAYTAAVCGADGYKNLVEILHDERTLPLFQNKVLGQDSKGNDVSFTTILDSLNKLRKDGIFAKESFTFTQEDEKLAMKKKKIYANAMFLSDFHQMEDEYTYNYNTTLFPMDQDLKVQGITAPSIVIIETSKRKITPKVLAFLQEVRVQEYLSYQTGFAPAARDAQGADTDSDDIHYFANTTLGGALPDLYHACFKNKTEAEPFAEQLRLYILSDLSHVQ